MSTVESNKYAVDFTTRVTEKILGNRYKDRAKQIGPQTLLEFTQTIFPSVNPIEFVTNWHHEVLGKVLDDFVALKIKRLVINAPPRYSKSEMVSRNLPAYILGRDPNAKIIATSYSAKLAYLNNRGIQKIIDSPVYQSLYPETKLFPRNVRTVAGKTYLRNNETFEIVNHYGSYVCAGLLGGLSGFGARYILIDDPLKNAVEANSKVYRDRIKEEYDTTIKGRLEDHGGILLMMTRWHKDDLAGRLIQEALEDLTSDQWTVITFSAICDDESIPYDPRKLGEPLWPWKHSLEELNAIRSANEYAFQAMFQQRPTSKEGNIFEDTWWNYWTKDTLPTDFDVVVQSWDMTFGAKSKTASYVVGQVWGKKGANYYLIYQIRKRMTYPEMKEAMRKISLLYPDAIAKIIENKADGAAIIQDLHDEIDGLLPFNPVGDKVFRANQVSPIIKSGNVYLPPVGENPWVREYIAEFRDFPFGLTDDQVDTTSQALIELRKMQKRTDITKISEEALIDRGPSPWDLNKP